MLRVGTLWRLLGNCREYLREEDGHWLADIAAFPGVTAHERTRKQATASVQGLAFRPIADRLEHGEAVPGPMNFGTSAQVLQEFFVTVVRKASRPLSAAEALEWIEEWAAFPCQAIDRELVQIAVALSQRFAISYWDAAILAAAEALGSHVVYSEDLNDGQQYGQVRVASPFS